MKNRYASSLLQLAKIINVVLGLIAITVSGVKIIPQQLFNANVANHFVLDV